ncbi:hypothetical protein HO133_006200 [Letharia lupina]|uniref:Uncharacterized protein n=1 Tax=Letharia lupina TaxID=560253 RepID=A0A8H6F868_9LECA|nr:uncharacterized protein HO133_006200 [Letharia lupina]KAF6218239.1 hypothetical protein HO133_006200 [Letharia lupina]
MYDYDPHAVHAPGDQHIKHVPLTSLSKLSPYSALTLSIVLVILFLLKQYIIEAFLLKRLYGSRYTQLNEVNRRGFVNHHIAGATKLMILVAAVYPFINVAFRYAVLNDPYARGSRVTLGDVLVVCTQVLVGMYIFELIYRVKISHISAMHHIGTIMVAQAAIAISLDLTREKDASIEFILCTVWGKPPTTTSGPQPRHRPPSPRKGPPTPYIPLELTSKPGAFDIVCELLPHIAIILYRLHPSSPLFLSRLFAFASATTLFGTLAETLVIFYLFGSLWPQWQLAFKIVTPILHCAFSATQLHGSHIFYRMWKRQVGILEGDVEGLEAGAAGVGGLEVRAEDSCATLTDEHARRSVLLPPEGKTTG